jgi:hypothetical protein
VVRDDIIFGIASFPLGEENIIQTSLDKTNLSKQVFLSHINIGSEKNFDMVSHNRGADLLKFGFNQWKEKLKDSLSKICTEINIPNDMFIIKNSVISGILSNELSDKENKKKLEILGSKIEVSAIQENTINDFIFNGKAFPNEPYIKMDLIFLDKMFKK